MVSIGGQALSVEVSIDLLVYWYELHKHIEQWQFWKGQTESCQVRDIFHMHLLQLHDAPQLI